MILKESAIEELQLRDQHTTLTKINTIRVESGEEDSGTDKK